MYKVVDISAETWINAEVSVIKIHDNVNKTLLKLLCISDIAKSWGGQNIYDLIDKETKGKYRVKNMTYKTTNQKVQKQIGEDYLKAANILCTLMKILQL